jgi:photosystem II stability/assembly factor-like uncharacterized protein
MVEDSTYLFASLGYYGMYRSSNMGQRWEEMNKGLDSSYYRSWNISATATTGKYVFAASGSNIYRTEFNGSMWINMHLVASDSTAAIAQISSLATVGPYLFVSTDRNGIYRTDIDGRGYRRVNTGLTDSSIIALTTNGTNLYATAHHGIFKSTDFGDNWDSIAGRPNATITALSVSDNSIYAGTNNGVFVSSDYGKNWNLQSNGLDRAKIVAYDPDHRSVPPMIVKDGYLFAGTNYGTFRSSDNGESWSTISIGHVGNGKANCFSSAGNILFAGTDEGDFKSSDNGDNWVSFGIGLQYPWMYTIVSEDSLAIATTMEPIHDEPFHLSISHDMGATWTPLDHLPFATSTTQFANFIYVGGLSGNGGVIFRTSDNGYTWEEIDSGVREFGIYGGYTPDVLSILSVGSSLAALASDGLYLTDDSGISWRKVASSPPGYSSINTFLHTGSLFITATNQGVFVSNDSGGNWLRVVKGMTDTNIVALVIQDSVLFAGTKSGLWRRSLPDIVKAARRGVDQDSIQHATVIAGNTKADNGSVEVYPNPVSHSATIRFISQESGVAEIRLVNLLGVETARIFSGELEAGSHSFVWSAPKELTPGMYECVVTANGRVQSIPIVLAR